MPAHAQARPAARPPLNIAAAEGRGGAGRGPPRRSPPASQSPAPPHLPVCLPALRRRASRDAGRGGDRYSGRGAVPVSVCGGGGGAGRDVSLWRSGCPTRGSLGSGPEAPSCRGRALRGGETWGTALAGGGERGVLAERSLPSASRGRDVWCDSTPCLALSLREAFAQVLREAVTRCLVTHLLSGVAAASQNGRPRTGWLLSLQAALRKGSRHPRARGNPGLHPFTTRGPVARFHWRGLGGRGTGRGVGLCLLKPAGGSLWASTEPLEETSRTVGHLR